SVPIRREVAQVVHLHVERPAADGSSKNAGRQRLFHHRRKDCDDVESHRSFSSSRPSGGSTTIRRPATSIVVQMSIASGICTSPRAPPTISRLPPAVPSTSCTTPTLLPDRVSTLQPTRS